MTMENVEVRVRVSCADCANWCGGCRRNWKVVRYGVCSKFYVRSDRAGWLLGNEIDRRFAGGPDCARRSDAAGPRPEPLSPERELAETVRRMSEGCE